MDLSVLASLGTQCTTDLANTYCQFLFLPLNKIF